MKKIIALLLAVLMLSALTGCDAFPTMDELCGVWEMPLRQDADTAKQLLENVDFYPEEIAMIDLENLDFIMVVEFRQDGTYRYGFDVEATKANLYDFYAAAIDTLYVNRESLTDTYGTEIMDMTQEEFGVYYAELFEETTLDGLLNQLVEYCLDYDSLGADLETGTFRMLANSILCTIDGQTQEEQMDFTIEGDTLTLIYSDDKEVYTRKN